MAVIKCSNCENEILDTEIVCPYCDCPISETIKKMQNDDLASYSLKSIDGLTGKIPAIKDTEPQLATSSDFEKEKAAILENLDIGSVAPEAEREQVSTQADVKADISMDKTVKISRQDITSSESKKTSSATATIEKPQAKSVQAPAGQKKNKLDSKYIVFGITIVVIVLVVYIIWGIVGSITEKLEGKKIVNKKSSATSSATLTDEELGFRFHSETLTVLDDKVMKDYTSSIETPWYEYITEIKYVTMGNNVTKIGAHAFEGFDAIRDLTLSANVESIGDYAFKGCDNLEKIKIPNSNSLDEIGESAFESCKRLKDIAGYTKKADFEPTLSKLGDRAFANCAGIAEFKLPMYAEIGEDAFDGHSDDFTIICETSGDVYDYAKENSIPTKLNFEGEIIEEPQTEEPKNEEPKENKPKDEPAKKPETSAPSQSGNEQQPAGTETPKKDITALMNELNKASTQEEKDRILAEIDKAMQ